MSDIYGPITGLSSTTSIQDHQRSVKVHTRHPPRRDRRGFPRVGLAGLGVCRFALHHRGRSLNLRAQSPWERKWTAGRATLPGTPILNVFGAVVSIPAEPKHVVVGVRVTFFVSQSDVPDGFPSALFGGGVGFFVRHSTGRQGPYYPFPSESDAVSPR